MRRTNLRASPARWPAIAVVAVALASPAAAQVSFRPLGFAPGRTSSRAEGISADGTVVVGSSGDAFRWTEAGGMVPLGSLPSTSPSSAAIATSQDGSFVAGYSTTNDGLPEAVRWTPQGIEELGFLPGAPVPVSWADDISADGSVVVGRGWTEAVPGGLEAFRWTPASGMVGLGVLPDHIDSEAHAVSADGSVVVGYSTQDLASIRAEAFRWTEPGGIESLGFLPGGDGVESRSSTAFAVSADGSVIFGTAGLHYADGAPSSTQMFRWTADGGMVGLGVRPALVRPAATNADGTVAVGVTQIPGGEAMLWDTSHGHRELDQVLARYGVDISGWTRTSATGISADGTRVVGYGRNPSGRTEAWLATLPPPGPECDNGFDDDGDGLADMEDPGCPFPEAAQEDPLCDDGLDNDGDGFVDFDDPQCATTWPYWERWPCGLGVELVGVIGLFTWIRRRNAHRAT